MNLESMITVLYSVLGALEILNLRSKSASQRLSVLEAPYWSQDSGSRGLGILNLRSKSGLKRLLSVIPAWVYLIILFDLCAVNAIDSAAYGYLIQQPLNIETNTVRTSVVHVF